MSNGDNREPAETVSYHGQPVLKVPVWTAEIPIYFYFGGLAGASGGLAYLSGLGGEEVLARRAWATALAGLIVSPGLLISDLGRPERFLNMLRMFKVTSPMSVGSWIISGSGAATAIAAVNAWTGALPRAARLARPAAALLGLPLSTYTAALVANTAVPVWHQARRELPFVFASGAALSAGAAGVITTPPEHAGPARRLALGAAAIELGTKQLMERRLGAHGELYKHGTASRLARVARGCSLVGWAVLALRGPRSRSAAVAAGALLTASALGTRASVFEAGRQSAADPRYVVGPQREEIEAGRRKGAARRESRVSVGDPSLGSPATAR
jgi:hypothetical protein